MAVTRTKIYPEKYGEPTNNFTPPEDGLLELEV
jgi:hypothetical protein